jgi:hypothetical protein
MSEDIKSQGANTMRGTKTRNSIINSRVERVSGFNLSVHIDNLIKNSVKDKDETKVVRDLFIPGLDDDLIPQAKASKAVLQIQKMDSSRRTPNLAVTTEGAEEDKNDIIEIKENQDTAQLSGNVGTYQTSFNMLKVFMGIGILATPASF